MYLEKPKKQLKKKIRQKNEDKPLKINGITKSRKDWQDYFNEVARKRDKCCQYCGTEENLQAHHHYRQGFRFGTDFSNLNKASLIKRYNIDWIITLCHKHHLETQAKFMDYEKFKKINDWCDNYIKENKRNYKGEVITLEDCLLKLNKKE